MHLHPQILLVLGCFLVAVVFVFLKRLFNSARQSKFPSTDKFSYLEEERERLLIRVEELSEERDALIAERARLAEALRQERLLADERQQFMEKTQSQLREAFQSLSGEALDRSSRLFLTMAEEKFAKLSAQSEHRLHSKEARFSEIVEPIAHTLQKLDQQIQTVEKDRISSRD